MKHPIDSVFAKSSLRIQGMSSRQAALVLVGLSLIPLLVVFGLIWQMQYRSLIQQAGLDMAALARQAGTGQTHRALPAGMSVVVSDMQGSRLANVTTDGLLAVSMVTAPHHGELLMALRNGHRGLLHSTDTEGRAYLHHIETVTRGDAGLQVAVSAAVDDLVQPQLLTLAATMAGLLGVLLLYSCGVWQLGRRWLLNPLDSLANQMKEMELGVYEGGADVPRAQLREIGVLQHGLGAMWSGLTRRGVQRDAALAGAVQAREELHSVINQMSDGFLVLDDNWRITFCNRHIADMLHSDPQALEGRVFWSLFSDDTRRNVRATCEWEILQGRPFATEDFHPQHRRWLERKFFASELGIGVIVRDTTNHWELVDELRARERRYSDMFEANPNVMWIFDTETLKFLAVNAAATQRYGYSETEFLALRVTDIGPDDDREQFIEEMLNASENESLGDEARIWRHQTKHGELMLVDLVHHAIKYKNRPARLIMATDVTSRLTAESKLRGDYAKLVRRYDEATRALLAARQVINGHVAMFHDDVLPTLRLVHAAPPVAPPEAGRVRDESERVTNLLEEALELTHIGRAPFERSPVDLSHMAEDVLASLARRQPLRQVHVEVEPGMTCRGEPRLVRHLLEALLDNAWKFTSLQDNAWIRLGRTRPNEGNRNPGFYVSDNGVGFDEAEEDKLYVPLARLAAADKFPGHGFGLAKAHAVVSRHGGRIWCYAKPGKGATFHFELESLPRVSRAMVTEVVIDSVPPWDD